jgi:hypothetical protein
MAEQSALERNLDSADDEPAPWHQRMHVEALAHPK